jgi:3-dehydrotetronate 4-kinase
MRTVQYSGVPSGTAGPEVEAGIVALKSRTIPAADAVAQSLAALRWLQQQGCRQFFFKYCSTFDSTPEGNIGPVADALADALGADCVIVCPAFPSLKRSIFEGHLFVGDRLLNESGMEHHPLTPMTDPDLRRWLARQSESAVGHVPARVVLNGREAISAALDRESAAGRRLIVVDAIRDADLIEIGAAAADLPLITGGSGIALGLPANFRARGEVGNSAVDWMGVTGPCVALSGSCSTATRAQVGRHRVAHSALEVVADDVMSGTMTAERATAWALERTEDLPLIYSSAEPTTVKAAQEKYGRAEVAGRIERLFGEVARLLVAAGVTRIVSAGGETSGAVVEALEVGAMEIGPEIDPGVPALRVVGRELALALKSGNFGAADFFERAPKVLAGR